MRRIDAAPRRRALGGRVRRRPPGRWQYTIEAWTDVFATWRDELERKVAAGQHDLAGELSEGLRAAAGRRRARRAKQPTGR